MGLIWMVLQSIGSATILSSLESGIKDFVLIGNLTLLPQCREVFPAMEKLYGVRFRIPKYSEFCTAIGAALDYKRQANNHPRIAAMPYTRALRRFAFSILSQSTDNKLKTHTSAQNAQHADR